MTTFAKAVKSLANEFCTVRKRGKNKFSLVWKYVDKKWEMNSPENNHTLNNFTRKEVIEMAEDRWLLGSDYGMDEDITRKQLLTQM